MIAAVLLALLAIAVPAAALDPYGVSATDAVINGKAIIRGTADRACLNFPPLDADPDPAEGRAFYVVFTESRKQLCTQPSGSPFCVDLEPAP